METRRRCDGSVRTHHHKTMTLAPEESMRRLLLHVLPGGFLSDDLGSRVAKYASSRGSGAFEFDAFSLDKEDSALSRLVARVEHQMDLSARLDSGPTA